MSFKKFVVVAAVALAFVGVAAGAKAATWDFGTTTLYLHSSNKTAVENLQTALNAETGSHLTVDGNYGHGTLAAVEAFQASKGLKADGKVGPATKAALNNGGTVSSTPSTSTTCPAGFTCTPAAGTTPVNNSGMSGSISTDGVLGGFNNTVVGTGDQNHQVVGFQLTGAGGGSNLNLTSATVQFTENPASSGSYTGSNRFADYFSAVSIWENGTQVGSVPASSFSSNTNTAVPNYVYSATIPLSGATVTAGQNSQFYVAVSANTTIDTGNFSAGNKWMVQVNNIRSVDGTGVTLVYNPLNSFSSTWTADPSFSFGSTASANSIVLNVQRSGSDLNAHTVTVNATGGTTSKVPLLQLSLSSQGGQSIAVNKIPVTFTSSTTNINTLTNYVYLLNGSTVLDSETIPTGTASGSTIYFKINPASALIVTPGQTANLTIAADINSINGGGYTAGAYLTAATNIGSTAWDLTSGTPNGTELVTSSNATTLIPGTANGQQVAFYAQGVSVSVGSYSCSSIQSSYSGQNGTLSCAIPFTVSANGAPAYIPKDGIVTAVDGHNIGNTVMTAVNFNVVNSTAPGTLLTPGAVGITQSGSNASSGNNSDWVINAGSSASFTATVTYDDAGTSGQYRGYMTALPWNLTDTGTYSQDYNFNLGATNPSVPGYVYVR